MIQKHIDVTVVVCAFAFFMALVVLGMQMENHAHAEYMECLKQLKEACKR